jgi:MATE family multidrug resistance protein
VFYTTLWAFLLAVGYTAVYVLFGNVLVAALTGIESVRITAVEYMPWVLVSPVLSVWSFQLDGIFIGTTRTVEMRNAMLLSLGSFLAAVWVLVPIWANHGLWLSLLIFMVIRALTLGLMMPRIARGIAA